MAWSCHAASCRQTMDQELKRIQDLWLVLDQARYATRPGESLLDRLRQDPWTHDDSAVRSAWEALTSPENLAGLEQWSQGGFES